MTNIANLERLIQMATMEQMYSMLDRMKSYDTNSNTDTNTNTNNSSPVLTQHVVDPLFVSVLQSQNKHLAERLCHIENKLSELVELMQNKAIEPTETIQFEDKGQTRLTDYPMFIKKEQEQEQEQEPEILDDL